MGFLFYFLLMVLNSSAMFVNVFTGIGMKLDNFQNATLSNWSMLGYLIGGIATIWLSVKGVHFKYLFAAGFLLLGLSAMFMYFEVQGAGLYERMKYPVIIRSTGTVSYTHLLMPGSHVPSKAAFSLRYIKALKTPVTPRTLCTVDGRGYNLLFLHQCSHIVEAVYIVLT